jgi:hypothetical protein
MVGFEGRRLGGPDVRREDARAARAVVRVVGQVEAAHAEALEEIRRRLAAAAVGEALLLERRVAARAAVRGHAERFLLRGEREEIRRGGKGPLDQGRGHAVAGDDEEADLAAGLVDLEREGCGTRLRQVDDRHGANGGFQLDSSYWCERRRRCTAFGRKRPVIRAPACAEHWRDVCKVGLHKPFQGDSP